MQQDQQTQDEKRLVDAKLQEPGDADANQVAEATQETGPLTPEEIVARVEKLEKYIHRVEKRLEKRETQWRELVELEAVEKEKLRKGMAIFDLDQSSVEI